MIDVSELQRRLKALVASDLRPPSAALCVDAPRLGLHWRGGADGPLAAGDEGQPAERPFRIASIAKPFTAATVLTLVGDGRLDLRQAIAGLVTPRTREALEGGGYDPSAIRLAHLLCHTSGLFDHTEAPSYLPAVFASPARRWTRGEQIEIAMREGRPWGAPGAIYRYSDTGYIILGEIIERATGLGLAQAVRMRLRLDDLGLARTWWEGAEPHPADAPKLARQYAGEVCATDIDPSFDAFGGGGLVSTVGDLTVFLRALLGGLILPADQLRAALRTPPFRVPTEGPDPWRTHNHLLATMPAGDRWGFGHTGAWGSVVVHVPEHDAVIAATLNREGPTAIAGLRELVGQVTSWLDRTERRAAG